MIISLSLPSDICAIPPVIGRGEASDQPNDDTLFFIIILFRYEILFIDLTVAGLQAEFVGENTGLWVWVGKQKTIPEG